MDERPLVAVVMGSKSDWETMRHTAAVLEEFGVPEAFWVLEVQDFPAVVTMDSLGGSLHREVQKASEEHYRRLIG